ARFLAGALAIVAATAAVAAILGTWACASLHFAPKVLTPSLKRLHPLNYFKQMFSTKHMTSIAITFATALLIGLVGYAALAYRLPLFSAMMRWQSVEHGWLAGVDTLHSLLRLLLAVLIVPAIVSKLAAKAQHLQKLRMSHREAKEEFKQTTGDPLMRARQRAALHETASAPPGSNSNVTTGCALVIHPEHQAVMLYYEGDERSAPFILDKGAHEAARRMAAAAQSRSIPVFRFRKLAHRLYEHGQTHSIIPPDCYRAVAIIYRLVDEIQTHGTCPVDPIDVDDAFFDE
ncbi:MAG: type secretion protein, partial [Paraburkholderia sp.]|nr:type secretion protein [Paraburkholderia sp.]